MRIRDILREHSLGVSNRMIAKSVNHARATVAKVLEKAKALSIAWPLPKEKTDAILEDLLFPKETKQPRKAMPDFARIRAELSRKGVTKKLLWEEYCKECAQNNEQPFQYSRFCYLIQVEEMKHRASMHIAHRPGEEIEVDWAGEQDHIPIVIERHVVIRNEAFFGSVCSQFFFVIGKIHDGLDASCFRKSVGSRGAVV